MGWGTGPHLGISQGRGPASAPLFQVPDGATVALVPQLHNGDTISQSCPSGESESSNPDVPTCSQEPEAGRQESWSCHHLGLPIPCQQASQSSRLSRGPRAHESNGASWSGCSRATGCWAEQAPGLPPLYPHRYPLLSLAPPTLSRPDKRGGVGVRGIGLRSAHVSSDIPMLEDGEEGGVRLWHLVKGTEEPEGAKARRSSLRERERERARAKAIPEIYLTRLLSMKVGAAGEPGPRGASDREAP